MDLTIYRIIFRPEMGGRIPPEKRHKYFVPSPTDQGGSTEITGRYIMSNYGPGVSSRGMFV